MTNQEKIICDLISLTALSKTAAQVILKPQKHFNYQAGQYLELFLSEDNHRPFSIANAPQDNNQIELHVQTIKQTPFNLKLIQQLKEEKIITISRPMGQCRLQNVETIPTLFIAQGTAFSPVKSLIEQTLMNRLQQPIHLFWLGDTNSDFYLQELTSTWAKDLELFRVTYLQTKLKVELLETNLELIKQTLLDQNIEFTKSQAYAFGSFDLVFALADMLIKLGINREKIYGDAFEFVGK